MSEGEHIPSASLAVVFSDGRRRIVPLLQSPFLIGRGAENENHLQLPHKRISRRAAAITYAEGRFCLEDRGQRKGVFVNGEPIKSRTLHDGDIITFGFADSIQLVFQTGASHEGLPALLERLEQTTAVEPAARGLRPLRLLLEATALLQSHLPLEELLGAMVDRAVEVTHADRGLLLRADSAGCFHPFVARQRGGLPLPIDSIAPSQSALAQAGEQRRSVVEEDIARMDSPLREARSILAQELRSVIAIPLLALAHPDAGVSTYVSTAGDVLGILYLDSRNPAAFSRLERRVLGTLALEAAGVLDNARLVQKAQEQRRLEQELAIAREIQQALLPRNLQDFEHLQVTGLNRPCLAVGGDYFDVMKLGPGSAAFVIADVCGKGVGAALLTAMLQGTFFAINLGRDAASVFALANSFICARAEVERHATLFYGSLDSAGRLDFINSGHPPPLLIHAGSVEPAFPPQCIPLGLLPDTEFTPSPATLASGDTLVLYSDGITEAANPAEEQFGSERLQEVVRGHADATIQELQAAILRAVEEFTRDAPQADDLTLLIVRYLGNT